MVPRRSAATGLGPQEDKGWFAHLVAPRAESPRLEQEYNRQADCRLFVHGDATRADNQPGGTALESDLDADEYWYRVWDLDALEVLKEYV